ncbi:hypothetical protein MBAV_001497 [Candidatus Magnetobacterium bavaricum]|uniref:Uncharacterized protein n=1 Tax=Candidatus Magnetobacterium bavaricum TaxID=29290 RepID=A0A0F3H065_9BACT|nr:hypothetical protein MBAV_001497 [Candidatus Magnetobacterium bavaricum]
MVAVYSCGGGSGPGSPGSSNTGNIGGYVSITGISHSTPKGDKGDAWQIDMVQDICSGGSAEVWGDDIGNLTIALTSYDTKVPANTIFIQRYTVEYTQQIYELDLPPVKMFDLTTTAIVKPESTSTVNIVVMDAGTKQEYMKELNSGKYNPARLAPYLYDMKITIYGVDSLGNTFNVPVHRTVLLDDYNNC